MLEVDTLLYGRYRILGQIGKGGMGTVFLAKDQNLGLSVAIKQNFFDEARLIEAFKREARLLAGLRHSALPQVKDYFIEGKGQYLVMEHIAGDDMGTLLEKRKQKIPPAGLAKPFEVEQVVHWAEQLLDTLDYLHTRSEPVIHRDIKPVNLKLADRNQIILLDFGLAKGKPMWMTRVTSTGSLYGYTPNYAPLEQIRGLGTDPRSDLYALGATIYHLITGQPPIDAATRAESLIGDEPDPLLPANEVNPKVPRDIAEVLMKAMGPHRNHRPSSATELLKMLRAAKHSTVIDWEAIQGGDRQTQDEGHQRTAEQAKHATNDWPTTEIAFEKQAKGERQRIEGAIRQEQQEEQERIVREDIERQAREEAERRQHEEEERIAREQAERVRREESQRKAKEEAEAKQREEQEREAREEAQRLQREQQEQKEAERLRTRQRQEELRKQFEQENAQRLRQKEERERVAREEGERHRKEEEEGKAREAERLRLAREQEKKAQNELEQRQKEQQQRRAKEDAERLRLEETELNRLQQEKERKVAEAAEKLERQQESLRKQLAQEDAQRLQETQEQERRAREDAELGKQKNPIRIEKELAQRRNNILGIGVFLLLIGSVWVATEISNEPDKSAPNSNSVTKPALDALKPGRWVMPSIVTNVALSDDGRVLASAGDETSVHLWQASGARELIGHTKTGTSVAVSHDGQFVGSGSSDGTICLWRVTDGKLIKSWVAHTDKVFAVGFSPDSLKLFSAGGDKSVKLWSVSDGGLIKTVTRSDQNDLIVTVSPDLGLMGVYRPNRGFNSYRLADDVLVSELEVTAPPLNCGAFSSDGQTVALGGKYGDVLFFRVSDGRLIRPLGKFDSEIVSMTFSADGQTLAVGLGNGAIKLWRVTDGALIKTFHGHTKSVNSLSFNADGSTLVSGGDDETVRLWQVVDN